MKEEELDPTAYFENRSKMITELKQNPNTYPYPHKFHVDTTVHQFIQKFTPITENEKWLETQVCMAGRVTNMRHMGKKLVFYDIRQEGERLQVMCNSNNHKLERDFEELHSTIRRGDIIGVIGLPGRTKTGELTLSALEVKLLSPCLHMLPEAHTGFKDREQRYRKRYLDLIMNNKTRETFIMRSKVVAFVRKYLTSRDFIEVETPMMNMIPGGATARPFVTHHNDLEMKLYMRIAPELFLKECIVGGMERVFEIGKNFRNESIDQTHNPEYTACEFYMAYADFNDLMDLTEDMLSSMVKELTGSYVIHFHPDPENHPEQVLDIDFSPPWRRIPMMEGLEKELGVTLPKDLDSKETEIFFDDLCKKHKVDCSFPRTTTRLIDKLVGKFLESQCLNPTFIIEHPQQMSPLAKYHRSKPGLTERFELFIKHHEFCNAYTELNDPFVQKELFMQQVKEKEKGDDESMFYDEVFVNALEHALPPTAGWGLGIDRTVMLLADQVRIQEVLLFPAMKPEEKQKEEKVEAKVEKAPAAKVEEAPKQ